MPRPIPFQRRDRQLGLTRELSDLHMIAARDAAGRAANRAPGAPAGQDPTLVLARATRAVTMLVTLENRIAANG